MALDIVGQIVTGLTYVVFAAAGFGVFAYLVFIRQFKHVLIERHQTKNTELIRIHKCREYTDRNKIVYWQKLKGFKKINVPPSESLKIDYRGRKFVEVAVSPDGSYEYLDINASNTGVSVQGLTTNDRMSLINEIEKAHSYKKRSIGEMLMQLAPLFAVVVISVSLMIFWGEMAQPVLQAQELQNGYAVTQQETLKLIQDINLRVQSLDATTPASQGAPQ